MYLTHRFLNIGKKILKTSVNLWSVISHSGLREAQRGMFQSWGGFLKYEHFNKHFISNT